MDQVREKRRLGKGDPSTEGRGKRERERVSEDRFTYGGRIAFYIAWKKLLLA